ncbi:MAG: site-specific DNA-methyltransferase [Alphaproteobacteria bacterium]|nr:site-specific DNA-methyltransferase [Alphaproteobacteria bacterium]
MNPVIIGNAILYNADCRDILPMLPGVDAVITDPPYGIKRHGQNETFTKLSKHNQRLHEALRTIVNPVTSITRVFPEWQLGD